MVTQYPHKFVVENPVSPALVNGEWVFPTASTTEYACRGEYNSRGRSVSGLSGELVMFDYSIYMPLIAIEYQIGAKCTLKITDSKQIKGTIKNQENGQLNTRFWL